MNPPSSRRTFLILAISLIILALAILEALANPLSADELAAWSGQIRLVDATLARGDVSGAGRAWHDAHLAALGSRRLDGMADVGDTALRIAPVSSAPRTFEALARRWYRSPLFHARQQRSLDGVLRVSDTFAALGDRTAARQGRVIANALASQSKNSHARERVRVLAERLDADSSFGGQTQVDPFPPAVNAAVIP